MRALLLALLLPTAAFAELSSDQDADRRNAPAFATVEVPCLRAQDERRYIVAWWIENKATGERRDAGTQEVRRRC